MVEKAICVVGPPKGVDTPDFDRSLTNAILNLLHAYESEFEAFLRERDGFFSYLRSHHVDNEDPYDTLFCLEVTEMNGQTYMVFISADRTAPPKDSVVMRCICDRPQYVYEMPMFDDVTFEMTRHLWQSPIVDRVRFTCVNPQKIQGILDDMLFCMFEKKGQQQRQKQKKRRDKKRNKTPPPLVGGGDDDTRDVEYREILLKREDIGTGTTTNVVEHCAAFMPFDTWTHWWYDEISAILPVCVL
jgi:hypothetical protein